MATIAVFVSLGGTSYAAITITGSQIKDGSVTSADIANESLTGSDVKGSSLTGLDIRDGSLGFADLATEARTELKGEPGTNGTDGANGAPGAVGPQGPAGTVPAYGAGNGLVMQGTTFLTNDNVTQTRVTGTCTAGAAIQSVAKDGTVTCNGATDPAVWQKRVGTACGAGTTIRSIAQDGTPTCDEDAVPHASLATGGTATLAPGFAPDMATASTGIHGADETHLSVIGVITIKNPSLSVNATVDCDLRDENSVQLRTQSVVMAPNTTTQATLLAFRSIPATGPLSATLRCSTSSNNNIELSSAYVLATTAA